MKNMKKIMAVTLVASAVVCGSAMAEAQFTFTVNATNPSNNQNLKGQCQYSLKPGAEPIKFTAQYEKPKYIPIGGGGEDLQIRCEKLIPINGTGGAGKGAYSGMFFYKRLDEPSQSIQFSSWSPVSRTCVPTISNPSEMNFVVSCLTLQPKNRG